MPILVIGAFSEVEVYHLRTIKVIVTDLEICMKFALKIFVKLILFMKGLWLTLCKSETVRVRVMLHVSR